MAVQCMYTSASEQMRMGMEIVIVCSLWTFAETYCDVTANQCQYTCEEKPCTELPKVTESDRKEIHRLEIIGFNLENVSDSIIKSLDLIVNDIALIKVLVLPKNNIKKLRTNSFFGLSDLKTLMINNNDISSIEPHAFRGLYALEKLDLHGNKINVISASTFLHLPSVTEINLANNGIRLISENAFQLLPNLQNVNITGNILHCQWCGAHNLSKRIEENNITVEGFQQCLDGDNKRINVTDIKHCQNPSSTQICPRCPEGATSLTNCFQATDACDNERDMVCRISFVVKEGFPSLQSSCVDRKNCSTQYMAKNVQSCENIDSSMECSFCCVGSTCTKQSHWPMEGFTYWKEVQVKLQEKEKIDEKFAKSLNSQLEKVSDKSIDSLNWKYLEQNPRGTKSSDMFVAYLHIKLGCDLLNVMDNLANVLQNRFNNNNVTIYTKGMCVKSYSYKYPSTLVNTSIDSAHCPQDSSRSFHVSCKESKDLGYPDWTNTRAEDCDTISDDVPSTSLSSLADKIIDKDSVSTIAKELSNVTSDWSGTSLPDVHLAFQIACNILGSGDNVTLDAGSASDLLSAIDHMHNINLTVLVNMERERHSVTGLLQEMDKFGGKMATLSPYSRPMEFDINSLSVLVLPSPVLQSTRVISSDKTIKMMINESNTEGMDSQGIVIELPQGAFSDMSKQANTHLITYHTPLFFQAIDTAKEDNTSSSMVTSVHGLSGGDYKIMSKVISATIHGRMVTNLRTPVKITFKHDIVDNGSVVCVFWDFASVGFGGVWSQDGCNTIVLSDHKTRCDCNHLTNFALLLDVHGTGRQLSSSNQRALSIISYVGCSIAFAGLLTTLVVYASFKKLRNDKPSKILLNLCVALLLTMMFFVIATLRATVRSSLFCKIMGCLLHYCCLSSFTWMTIEAVYMYLAVVRVFHQYFSHFMLRCSLVGWGLPLLVVIVTMAVYSENYLSTGVQSLCWLGGRPFYYFFVGPISLILMINLVIFILVVRELYKIPHQEGNKSRRADILSRVRGAFGIVMLLGLTWTFAFLSFTSDGIGLVFHYLFAIFNSSQGLFIFVFYCLLKSDVQNAVRRRLSARASRLQSGSNRGMLTSFDIL